MDSGRASKKMLVLLADSDQEQRGVAKAAFEAAAVDLHVVSDLAEGRQRLGAHAYDMVCTNWELIDLAKVAHETNAAVKTVCLASPGDLAKVRQYSFLENVISRSSEDRQVAAQSVGTTIRKLVSDDIFGLEKYVMSGTEVEVRSVTGSEKRWDLIDEMRKYFESRRVRTFVNERCQGVAEELLSNAIYDAPVDANGVSVYNHLPRVQAIELKSHEYATLRYATDGAVAVVSVVDPFGCFPLKTIIDYLESCYGGKVGSLNAEKGGAGMGVYQTLENSDMLVFNIKRGFKTEVIALFYLDAAIQKNLSGKAFHYYSQ